MPRKKSITGNKTVITILRNKRASHNKEYIVKQKGTTVETIWGPIGGWRKSKKQKFKSTAEAIEWAVKQIKSKVGRGYDVTKFKRT